MLVTTVPQDLTLLSHRPPPPDAINRRLLRRGKRSKVDDDEPGTPPLSLLPCSTKPTIKASTRAEPSTSEIMAYVQGNAVHDAAVCIIQRAFRCHMAQRLRSERLSEIGRPVRLSIGRVLNLQMLCDYRNISKMYCHVRVQKKPFGPFMFQYTTSPCAVKLASSESPEWSSQPFFVPMLSSKCDLVVTLIGVTSRSHQLRFLGQAIVSLGAGWESKSLHLVDLGEWKFPVEESLHGLNRFVIGSVEVHLQPLFPSTTSCMAGQIVMTHSPSPPSLRLFASWRSGRATAPAAPTTSVCTLSPADPSDPSMASAASPARDHQVTRWGVLTETHLHLYEPPKLQMPWRSLELAKIQLVQQESSIRRQQQSPGMQLYPIKIYCRGELYVLLVSSKAQQLAWHFRIHLHQRKLMIP